MPVTYHLDQRERLVYLTVAGDASYNEWEASMLAILADPSYRPGFGFLIDRRDATAPASDYIRRVIAFNRAHRGELSRGRRAVVVGSVADFGMGRMAEILGEDLPFPMRVFTNFDEALRWLLGQPD